MTITQPLVVRTMVALQQSIGNAQVQRLIAALEHSRSSRQPRSIQRYAVPGTLPCSDVVGWLDANSPYLPHGWARTDTNHTFNGSATVTTRHLESGDWEAHAQGHARLSVTTTNTIHMPTWVPSARPNRAGGSPRPADPSRPGPVAGGPPGRAGRDRPAQPCAHPDLSMTQGPPRRGRDWSSAPRSRALSGTLSCPFGRGGGP